MTERRALITGITGQDGSYLAELLLARGYRVSGSLRGDPAGPIPNLESIRAELDLHRADVTAGGELERVLDSCRPDELYHLAAPTFVPDSWADPAATLDAIAGTTARLLELVRRRHTGCRVMIASSSEVFGDVGESPQSESTPFRPRNPYGVAKLAAQQLAASMRSQERLHVSCAITYNHESPRRPERFVTRKVTRAAAAISLGLSDRLALGDLDVIRDWSHARDFMEAAWLMLQQPEGGDYVLASGRGHTVRELVATAFAEVGLDPEAHLQVDAALVREREPVPRVGDPGAARRALGWTAPTSFEEMIREMVRADLDSLSGAA